MERRINEFLWERGPHPSDPDRDFEGTPPKAWRYAVLSRDYAFSLTISAAAGAFHLHRGFGTRTEHFGPCDLLGKSGCIWRAPDSPIAVASPPGLALGPAMEFWVAHATQGVLEQPEKFWRALERMARAEAKAAKAAEYHQTRCPRCHGSGRIIFKPRANKQERP